MPKPYTIRLFVPEGDPSTFKIIDKMNWTGIGLEISREAWAKHKNRKELEQAGIYILFGYQEGDDLPTIYRYCLFNIVLCYNQSIDRLQQERLKTE